MNMKIYICALIPLIAFPFLARAEGGCPPGQMPNSVWSQTGSNESLASCMPIPESRSDKPQWETRWGAIASGGAFGIVTGMRSERVAKKAAIAECQKRGGTKCKEMLIFRNQCAAVVSSTSESFAQGAPYEDQAIAAGQKRCVASNTGSCWVYFSGCSLPVRIR